ncbi:hypothetical protein OAU50_06975 [Planctomycetota bacterium]|nr:hypothetical protein [Planctomycetota bacterium]
MAEENSGDWTAGIVAIVAALLLGIGVPVGLYYGLYVPRTKTYAGLEAKKAELKVRQEAQLVRVGIVKELKEDSLKLEKELNDAESKFSEDARTVISSILLLAEEHNLALLPERQDEDGANIAYRGNDDVKWKEGLVAVEVRVEATGTFHDFGRFMAGVEGLEDAVIIPKELIVFGDSSRGSEHRYNWYLYVVEKRDVSIVGRD